MEFVMHEGERPSRASPPMPSRIPTKRSYSEVGGTDADDASYRTLAPLYASRSSEIQEGGSHSNPATAAGPSPPFKRMRNMLNDSTSPSPSTILTQSQSYGRPSTSYDPSFRSILGSSSSRSPQPSISQVFTMPSTSGMPVSPMAHVPAPSMPQPQPLVSSQFPVPTVDWTYPSVDRYQASTPSPNQVLQPNRLVEADADFERNLLQTQHLPITTTSADDSPSSSSSSPPSLDPGSTTSSLAQSEREQSSRPSMPAYIPAHHMPPQMPVPTPMPVPIPAQPTTSSSASSNNASRLSPHNNQPSNTIHRPFLDRILHNTTRNTPSLPFRANSRPITATSAPAAPPGSNSFTSATPSANGGIGSRMSSADYDNTSWSTSGYGGELATSPSSQYHHHQQQPEQPQTHYHHHHPHHLNHLNQTHHQHRRSDSSSSNSNSYSGSGSLSLSSLLWNPGRTVNEQSATTTTTTTSTTTTTTTNNANTGVEATTSGGIGGVGGGGGGNLAFPMHTRVGANLNGTAGNSQSEGSGSGLYTVTGDRRRVLPIPTPLTTGPPPLSLLRPFAFPNSSGSSSSNTINRGIGGGGGYGRADEDYGVGDTHSQPVGGLESLFTTATGETFRGRSGIPTGTSASSNITAPSSSNINQGYNDNTNSQAPNWPVPSSWESGYLLQAPLHQEHQQQQQQQQQQHSIPPYHQHHQHYQHVHQPDLPSFNRLNSNTNGDDGRNEGFVSLDGLRTGSDEWRPMNGGRMRSRSPTRPLYSLLNPSTVPSTTSAPLIGSRNGGRNVRRVEEWRQRLNSGSSGSSSETPTRTTAVRRYGDTARSSTSSSARNTEPASATDILQYLHNRAEAREQLLFPNPTTTSASASAQSQAQPQSQAHFNPTNMAPNPNNNHQTSNSTPSSASFNTVLDFVSDLDGLLDVEDSFEMEVSNPIPPAALIPPPPSDPIQPRRGSLVQERRRRYGDLVGDVHMPIFGSLLTRPPPLRAPRRNVGAGSGSAGTGPSTGVGMMGMSMGMGAAAAATANGSSSSDDPDDALIARIVDRSRGFRRGGRPRASLGGLRTLGDYVLDDDFDDSYEALTRLSALIGDVPKGCTSSCLDSLPKSTYSDLTLEKKPGTEVDVACAICLDEYKTQDTCIKLPKCSHFYHQDCLEQWLKKATTCPICREEVADKPSTAITILEGPLHESPSSRPFGITNSVTSNATGRRRPTRRRTAPTEPPAFSGPEMFREPFGVSLFHPPGFMSRSSPPREIDHLIEMRPPVVPSNSGPYYEDFMQIPSPPLPSTEPTEPLPSSGLARFMTRRFLRSQQSPPPPALPAPPTPTHATHTHATTSFSHYTTTSSNSSTSTSSNNGWMRSEYTVWNSTNSGPVQGLLSTGHTYRSAHQ